MQLLCMCFNLKVNSLRFSDRDTFQRQIMARFAEVLHTIITPAASKILPGWVPYLVCRWPSSATRNDHLLSRNHCFQGPPQSFMLMWPLGMIGQSGLMVVNCVKGLSWCMTWQLPVCLQSSHSRDLTAISLKAPQLRLYPPTSYL